MPYNMFSYNKNRKDGYSAVCKECKRQYDKEYREKNRAKIKENKAKYVRDNRDQVNERRRNSDRVKKLKERTKADPCFKLKNILRSRLHSALNGKSKCNRTENYLGCSVEEFKAYIESKFKEGMSWDNYSFYTWHLDHIKPCALFDLSREDEIETCFHYTNYQPLWAKENLSKQAKYKGVNYSKRG